MPPISIMIKPASSQCNLRCKYCFYHDVASSRERPSRGMMSTGLMEIILRKAFAFSDGDTVMVSFQGGEPLLRGKDFFRAYIDMLKRLNISNSKVYTSIQTNATLIDDEWCKIFYRGDILVGVSLDGDRQANRNRVDADGTEVFDKIIAATDMLKKHCVRFNILSVLTKDSAKRIADIYSFFKKQDFTHLQFIPCLKPLDKIVENEDLYLDSSSYKIFLLAAFVLYLNDYKKGNFVSIRQFDNFVRLAHHQMAEQCGMNGHCTYQYVVEADGETYPCDFYCTDKYSLGNIKDTTFRAMSTNPVALEFLKSSVEVMPKCKKCVYYSLCAGGCKRERIDLDKCDAYKAFFDAALPHLISMS